MIKPLVGARHTMFDPTGMEYNHAGNPGCYTSNMTGIPDYVLVFQHLEEAFDNAYVKDLLLLPILAPRNNLPLNHFFFPAR
jgi:hypothetical protein